jgi:hypothetical protein
MFDGDSSLLWFGLFNLESHQKVRISEESIMALTVVYSLNGAYVQHLIPVKFHLFSVGFRSSVFDVREDGLSVIQVVVDVRSTVLLRLAVLLIEVSYQLVFHFFIDKIQ